MVTPKRALGQNFLVNKKIIKDLVETAEIAEDTIVLEIGAGTGNVTQELARRAKKVIAVEFDRALIPVLQKNLQNHNNIKIINKDILKLNLDGLRHAESGTRISTIVGSIPYQITSPLIHKLLIEAAAQEITLLIQKEVAEKITAETPNANYLSNFVQGLADVKYIRKVPKKSFKPQPKVEGAIIKIEPHYNILKSHEVTPKEWSKFLHKGFRHPRKMLRNTFNANMLKDANIDPRSRPQKLEVTQWLNLLKKSSR